MDGSVFEPGVPADMTKRQERAFFKFAAHDKVLPLSRIQTSIQARDVIWFFSVCCVGPLIQAGRRVVSKPAFS